RRHLAPERLNRLEFLLVTDPAYEGDINGLPVQVGVEVEQEHFEQGRAIIEHWAAAEARHAILTLAADIGPHGINAMLEVAGRIEPEIGSGKAEITPALIAMDDLAGHKPRRAQQLRRLYNPAGRKCRAYCAG